MLYPIELTFENAREFNKQTVYFADPNGFQDMYKISKHYKDNVLIGGLNGTGKSTIAAVFICILNADINEADPIDLISSSQRYTDDIPWLFKGRLIFYNDGSLEDNKMFIEINARFEGVTEYEKPKIRSKYFTIKEADTIEGLKIANEYVFSNKNDKYSTLEAYKRQIEALGISPDKYLLYWKQGETSKFTQIKDIERFIQLARMMGIEENIRNLDRMTQQQTEKERELVTIHNNCSNLEIELRNKEIDKNEKEKRDEDLVESSASFLGEFNALIDYNSKTTEVLGNELVGKEQQLTEQNGQKTKIEEEIGSVLEQRNVVQEDYDHCKAKTETVNIQISEVTQTVTTLEQEVADGKTKYTQIEEFLDILKKEELGIEEIQKLIDKLQSEIANSTLSIEQKKATHTEKEKLSKELGQKITDLELAKSDLERQIILAQQIIDENPSSVILQTEIENTNQDIGIKNITLADKHIEKANLEKELTAVLLALDFHAKATKFAAEKIQIEMSKEQEDIKRCREELQKLNNKSIILENELSKDSVEQLSYTIATNIVENENLMNLKTGYMKIVERLGPTVIGLYHSIKKQNAQLLDQIREIDQGLQRAETQIDMTKQSLNACQVEQQNTQSELQKYSFVPEEYQQKINESRESENVLSLLIRQSEQHITGLEDELKKVDQGIIDYSQRESMEKQGFKTYAFQDIFEFKDAELNREKENALSLLKYTIFVVADEKELFPFSGHYHIPLNEYSADNSSESLPFGLSLKSDTIPVIAQKAASWLRKISHFLGAKGLIKDHIGMRGYDPENVNYCLSTAAREYTKSILREKISALESSITDLTQKRVAQHENTEKLENDNKTLVGLLAKLNEVEGKIVQFVKTLGQYLTNEENLKAKEIQCHSYLEIVNSVIASYKETYDKQRTSLSFSLDDIVSTEKEYKEQINLYENNQKSLTETSDKIEAYNIQISKLESKLAEYKQKQLELEKFNVEIKEWIALKVQEEEKFAFHEQLHVEKTKLYNSIEQWTSEFNRDFSQYPFYLNIRGSMVKEKDNLPLESTQIKAGNLFLYEKNMFGIISDIEKTSADIERLKQEQFRRNELLIKVVNAQNTVERMPEKDGIVEAIFNNRIHFSNVNVDMLVLDRELKVLEETQQQSQSQLNLYQEYFDKHQEIDFDFYARYNLILKKLTIEREIHRELLKTFQTLTNQQNDYRQKIEQIQVKINPLEENLRVINAAIQKLDGEIDRLVGQLKDFEKDITPTINEEYDYRQVIDDNFSQITIGDCLPAFRLMYNGKFSEAIQEGFMLCFDEFVKSLYIESPEIKDDKMYNQNRVAVTIRLKAIRTQILRTIKESAVRDYEAHKIEFEKNMYAKERLEAELADFKNIVEADYRTVEGIITSSVRAISEKINEVIAPMNYTVQLEYENKEEGRGYRRLVMWFKKTHEQQMRLVTERGGLSGGEHAVVSLMMMYSILSVKEGKKMEGKSGGYLLLDEWDANLDPLKSQSVFKVLKKLGKKIISITPRSSSRNYLSEFGLLLRVINTPNRHGIVVLKERDEEALNEFFTDLETEENRQLNKVLATN
ncbi:MAG: coiled-coil domain-containing protein [Desulfitobacteriaceae bacterium]